MIIHDFDIFGPCFRPPEAQTKLIIDTDAVLTRPVAFERLQSIAGWYAQVLQSACDLQLS
jgi:hypothetical protein